MPEASSDQRALLFDLDGTLIDSNPHSQRAWADWHARRGFAMNSSEFIAATSGPSNAETFTDLFSIDVQCQDKREDTRTDVGWGDQIRPCLLEHGRTKGPRTSFETSITQTVLVGDLDPFIDTSLKRGP